MTLKKALVAITVVAMLFGMVSTAFAGGFTDITDAKVAAAATRLNALSIMKGFPDGSFGGTQSITRAQFAAVAVRALGLDNAATYAAGITKFSDVAANHWASGYVNVAAQQGIIAGFPDGTFHPEDQVTYAQALTIIVRMLGYAPVTEGKGTWPANYIVQAAKIGFTSGVSFAANDPATRGNVALFVDSSLSKDLMENTGAVGSAQTYEIVPGDNILKNYLGATKTSGVLTSSPDILGTKTINIGAGALTLADGVSVAGLLGQNVNVWSINGKVVLVQSTETNVVSGKIQAYTAGTSIKVGGTTYDATGSVVTAAFGAVAPGTPVVGDDVRIVLNSSNVVKTIVSSHYIADVVTDTDVDGKLIYTNGGTLDFSSSTGTFVLTGAATKIADLKADDVIQYYQDGTGNTFGIVTRNAKSGTVTQAFVDGSATIGGSTYTTNTDVVWDATVATQALSAYLGKSVDLLLDKDGKIESIALTATAAAAKNYAFATTDIREVASTNSLDYYFTATKTDNSTVYLKLASKVSFNGGAAVTGTTFYGAGGLTAAPELISYTVDASGNVNAITEISTAGAAVTLDTTYKLAGGKLVTSSTVIADVLNSKFISSADLFNLSVSGGNVVADSTGVKASLVVVRVSNAAVSSTTYAYLTGVYQDADAAWHATALANGATADYVLASGFTVGSVDAGTDALNAAALTAGTLYVPTFTAGDVSDLTAVTDVNAASLNFDHNVVVSFDSANGVLNFKTVNASNVQQTTGYTLTNSKTVVIDNTGSAAKIGSTSLLTSGKKVELYQLGVADSFIDVIVVD